MELVREAAEESDYVLEKPGLLITFDQFGDNSLEIMLRCFIESPAYRREAKSALNLAIDKKFRDAGIVVAFPQRDIHLDTERPLDIRIHEGAARPGEK
jgi:potassium efflux system protein